MNSYSSCVATRNDTAAAAAAAELKASRKRFAFLISTTKIARKIATVERILFANQSSS